jgi:hypothetical protein
MSSRRRRKIFQTNNKPPIEPLFIVAARSHGNVKGKVRFAWESEAKYMASTGTSKVVHIHRAINKKRLRITNQSRQYVLYRQITPPGTGICCGLEWNRAGSKLAILQESSPTLVIWNADNGTSEQLNIGGRDHLCFVKFSIETNHHLAVGAARGTMFIFNGNIKKTTTVKPVTSGKIIDGAWSKGSNLFAWVTADKHVHCCNSDGSIILHQDLTKSSTNIHRHPTGISFRPPNAVSDDDNNGDDGDDDDDDNSNNMNVSSLLCVEFGGHGCLIDDQEDDTSTSSMSDKTSFLLLFNVSNSDEGIDLEFRSEYGTIVGHRWDDNGMLMVGFSNGYVCGLSCSVQSI